MAIKLRNTAGKTKSKPSPKTVGIGLIEKSKCQLCDKMFPLTEGKLVGSPKKFACPTCVSQIKEWRGPKVVKCDLCPNVYDLREHGPRFLPGTTKMPCPECYDRHHDLLKGVGDKAILPAWFVLSCEPGKENAVRKDILKKVKLRKIGDKVLRMFSPMHMVERMVKSLGEVVAMNEGLLNPNDARAEVQSKLWELERESPNKKFHHSMFQDQKTGKWSWKIREDLCEEVLAIVKRRKYPGYIIVHMVYDKDTADVFKRQGKCWGLLLQDYVPVGLKVAVSWLASREAWRWTVKNLVGKELAKGHVSGTGPKAKPANLGKDAAWEHGRTKAKTLKTDHDLPTGLETEEAAIELINDKMVKEVSKDVTKKSALSVVPYGPGDEVIIKHGPWTGNKARVAVIDREKDNPECSVLVTTNVLGGTMITLRFRHHQLVPIKKESK